MNESATREYKIWSAMRNRCLSPNSNVWEHYGGNGITICDRWKTLGVRRKQIAPGYLNFLEDMGRCPDGLSLDRIDGSKGYSPENCRWATRAMQTHNRKVYSKSANSTEVQGVSWEKKHPNGKVRYRARIKKDGVTYQKRFDSLEEARKWRIAKERELYN